MDECEPLRTGVSLEHCHYIATRMRAGFQPRLDTSDGGGGGGHEIPVVVRESTTSDQGGRGLHSFPVQLNLSSPVHRVTQINS